MEKLKLVSDLPAKQKQSADACQFKVNDLVALSAGGPAMSVEKPGPVWTTCRYFGDACTSSAEDFLNANLVPYVEEPEPEPEKPTRRKPILKKYK